MTNTTKGDRTREAILRQAADLASLVGLHGLTIGRLAEHAGMSNLDRLLERGSYYVLRGRSYRTRHLKEEPGTAADHEAA